MRDHLDELIGRNCPFLIDDYFEKNNPHGKVLEIGCSDGWRLEKLRNQFRVDVHGIDPSLLAIHTGRKSNPNIHLQQGTADRLYFPDNQFDVVIFGFCLYLVDREDLIKVVAECDRVLKPGGEVIIYDWYTNDAYANDNKHYKGLRSFKRDYSEMFLWNPCYYKKYFNKDGDNPDDYVAISVLEKRKDI